MADRPPYDPAGPIPDLPDGFGVNDLVALTGLSYRMADYWARTGPLRPSVADATGSGSRRVWSADDILAGRVAAALRALGTARPRLEAAVAALRARPAARWLAVPHTDPPAAVDQLADAVTLGPAVVVVDLDDLRARRPTGR